MSRPPARPLRGLFVTGTDTGVGKTLIASALLRHARRTGMAPIPFKPVETGCDPDPLDARLLWKAAQPPISQEEVCPYPLRLPAAPAQAAAAAGLHLDLDALASQARDLSEKGDFILVEGAGGLLVPYSRAETGADLAARLGLPLLVIARTALGTINHTALTLLEARRRKLRVAGYLLNRTTSELAPHETPAANDRPPGGTNGEAIAALTSLHPLGLYPFVPPAVQNDPDQLADVLVEAVGESALGALLSG